ncbi:hypothetical protein N658DRAFT_304244 [Parathielavia hyrcaniae]|uniref:Uncharacterized protein n=1 Tax=Parathielavia hyrcaniae TaxID=113614 RepID=A0AAN6Q417_9PEZI|nr:hypothetical protein N658DRAFT_304244 [Parathielavia hyrcaniae]
MTIAAFTRFGTRLQSTIEAGQNVHCPKLIQSSQLPRYRQLAFPSSPTYQRPKPGTESPRRPGAYELSTGPGRPSRNFRENIPVQNSPRSSSAGTERDGLGRTPVESLEWIWQPRESRE